MRKQGSAQDGDVQGMARELPAQLTCIRVEVFKAADKLELELNETSIFSVAAAHPNNSACWSTVNF